MCYIEVEGGTNSEATAPKKEEASSVKEEEAPQDQSMKKRYSPAVLRLSQENDIDLTQVNGTGRGGRITRKDIEKVIAQGNIPKASESSNAPDEVKSEQKPEYKVQTTPSSSPQTTTQTGIIEITELDIITMMATDIIK